MNKSNQNPANKSQNQAHLPNNVMVSRQIDSLREVLRRMRTAEASSLDNLIDQKLRKITEG